MRTAVIVGATGGIGAECARELGRRDYSLVLNGRRAQLLEEVAAEVDGTAVVGDCNDEAVVAELVSKVEKIDVLIHAAGILRGSGIREQEASVFEDVVRTNLFSPYLAVRAALPRMSAGARIVLVSSLTATQPMPGLTAYSAAKAGMNAFAAALAAEVERDGINVNLVSPGAVDTPMMKESVRSFAGLSGRDVAEVVGWLCGLEPRIMVPDIVFRAPDRGPFSNRVGGQGSAGISKPD